MKPACIDTEFPATAGSAVLEVNRVHGESAATTAFATSPFKLLIPRARGSSVWAYTSSFGGGLVAGDQTQLRIRLGGGTRCFLGTQASTKVYRNPACRPCSHTTTAVLEKDAILFFAPDPVQAFSGSTYLQTQEFHLAADAGLVLVDWFSAGRVARGERWDFKRFQTRNDVFISGTRVFLDSVLLERTESPTGSPHRAGRFNCFVAVAIVGAALRDPARALLDTVAARPVDRDTAVVCSASAIRAGVVIRIAAESVELAGRELHKQLGFAPALLGDDPWRRKW